MKRIIFLACAFLFVAMARANNVQISNVTTTVSGGSTVLHFNIKWDNSWRGGPGNNWDAVWVFVKYKDERGWYQHLDFTGDNISIPAAMVATVPSDHKGVFIYRSADGAGNVASTAVSLGVTQKPGSYDVKVFGVEMVYIPEGSFYLGHGGGNTDNFGEAGTNGNTPFKVTSIYAPSIGPYQGQIYDHRVSGSVSISSSFPSGFGAFYMMKYELSQGGYRDFLNAAPGYAYTILTARSDLTTSNYSIIGSKLFPNGCRNNLYISGNSQGTDFVGTKAEGSTATTYNGPGDGEWVAANFLYWSDAAAFLDWAALRPMTEFEYEKAINGPDAPNYPQFASGTYYQVPNVSAGGIVNANTNSETVVHPATGTNYFNSADFGINAPLRNGFVADANSTRLSATASYYGVMELSGNVWEPVVTVANTAGRSFNGTLGDGVTSALSGSANVTSWPGNQNSPTVANTGGEIQQLSTAGISKRGGSFAQSLYFAVSDENFDPADSYDAYPTTRAGAKGFGCRGVRQVLP